MRNFHFSEKPPCSQKSRKAQQEANQITITPMRRMKSEVSSESKETESEDEQNNLEDIPKLQAPKATKMDNFDKSFFLYKSDEHEVFHLHDYDHTSDLLILACNHDKTKKILIPTNKASLCKFIPYFSSMANAQNTVFKDFNDAIEKKTPYEMIFTFLRDPRLFGEYLKVMYTEEFLFTNDNCVPYFKIADYLNDTASMEKCQNYINQNLTFSLIVDLLIGNLVKIGEKSGRNLFEQGIRNYFAVYMKNRHKQEELEELKQKQLDLEAKLQGSYRTLNISFH